MSYGAPQDDGTAPPIPMTVKPNKTSSSNMQAQSNHIPLPLSAGRKHGPSQSRSMPSTPFQQPEFHSDSRASPEPLAKGGSPLSLPSDKSQTPPAGRKQYGGCKYETGMQRARRRVPYSLGSDPLEKVKSDLKTRLTHDENETLTQDVQKLYEELQPTPESELRRASFIEKLDKILRQRWPTSSTKVNVFGSTGNTLGTSDSDVDICITTDCKEMERVCSIAALLANHGMEKVVCVSSAKVPIVKVWDPELQVACDINVNNPLALENTQLVRTYVSIDSRVRPLAMIIKYWAKRRILNDAALGGTLSSYTWICLALNFLQTRDPPILPTLQQQPNLQPKQVAGVNVSFDRTTEAYQDFGHGNKSSLGELLFHFFRYYAHELDFEQNVVSVRLGRCLSKVEKSWHLLQDNRLSVEEPFNLSRNLANTADDTSMRGIHLELRRAFELLGDGKLSECCEQFEYPPDDNKHSDIFAPPSSRPIIAQLPIQPPRGGRNAPRGGRNATSLSRTSNGRRSSNPAARNSNYVRNLPYQMMTQEQQLQQQHQQHLLHDQLFQQYRYLQLQEQELRIQLYQQSLQQHRGLMASYGQGYGQYSSHDDGVDQVNGIGRAPLSAPLYQNGFPRSPYLSASQLGQGVSTNPPSPRLNSGIPDSRRYSRRTSLTQSAMGGSLRAQSQPARAVPLSTLGHLHRPDIASLQGPSLGRRPSASSTSQAELRAASVENGYNLAGSLHDSARRPAEYLGYYVGQSPSLSAYTHSTAISPIPSHAGLAIQNGGLSPRLAPAAARPTGVVHTPPLQKVVPSAIVDALSDLELASMPSACAENDAESSNSRSGPLIVDGSINSPRRRRTTLSLNDPEENVNFSASTSEDLAFDTPSSSDEQSQDAFENVARISGSPIIVNGSRKHALANDSPEYLNGHLPLRIALGNSSSGSPGLNDPVALTGLAAIKRAGGTAWPLDRQLSSVEEIRTPSPRAETFASQGSSPTGAKDLDHRAPNAAMSLLNGDGHGLEGPLTSRTNGAANTFAQGAIATVNGGGSSGWQTQKKKKTKRKTVKSENDAQMLNHSGGETLPADESLRKGG